MWLYLVVFRPFKEKSKNYLEIFNETCILCSACLLFGFSQINDDPLSHVSFGWAFVSILCFNVGVNVIKGLAESFIQLKQLIKVKLIDRCKKKSTVQDLRRIVQESMHNKNPKCKDFKLTKDL